MEKQQKPTRNVTHNFNESIQFDVCLGLTEGPSKLVEERARHGHKHYGSFLTAFNGRDAVRDFLEELADAVPYAEQVFLEAVENGANAETLEDLSKLSEKTRAFLVEAYDLLEGDRLLAKQPPA